MSIAVGVDPTSWLQQDGAESPADTMPDTTGDLSIFGWLNNLSPAVVLPAYKTGWVAFSTADLANPSYSDPFATVRMQQVDGAQAIVFTVGSGSGASVSTNSGVEKRAYLLTYDGTTHAWTFYIRRTAAWEQVGAPIMADFSGVTFTQMRLLNDGIASIGSMSNGYWRLFNGKKLTLIEAENEALSGVAITSGVTTDTPLIAATDLTDVSGGNSPWYANGAGLSTVLPGPLINDPGFVFCPETETTFVVAGNATTTGTTSATVAVTAELALP